VLNGLLVPTLLKLCAKTLALAKLVEKAMYRHGAAVVMVEGTWEARKGQ
jgi:hypothetical protein